MSSLTVAGCCVEDKAATDAVVLTDLVRYGMTTVVAPVLSKTQVRATGCTCFIQRHKQTTRQHVKIPTHKVSPIGIVIPRISPYLPVYKNIKFAQIYYHNYIPEHSSSSLLSPQLSSSLHLLSSRMQRPLSHLNEPWQDPVCR